MTQLLKKAWTPNACSRIVPLKQHRIMSAGKAPTPMIIDGTIIAGYGGAQGSLPKQWPTLIRFFPAMANCVKATINVQLTHALTSQNPDLTLDVRWDGGLEPISLVEIKFECPLGDEPRQAWFYFAHGSLTERTHSMSR
jgi:hypothetical protein